MECIKERELEFVKELKCLEHKKYIEKYFLFSAAPVLTGVKTAVLISFKNCCMEVWKEQMNQLENITGLVTKELYRSCETFSVLIYNKELLETRVNSPIVKEILKRHDYPADDLKNMLEHLSMRFTSCRFPHEIGVFLGYPPEDVCSFIEKSGKDYLCCRYWKVYHDEERALEIFRFIDSAKAKAVELLKQHIPLHRVAKMLATTEIA